MPNKRQWTAASAGCVALAALMGSGAILGCADLTVPNYNNPSIEALQSTPTRTAVITATTGLLIGGRANLAAPNAYVSLLGILGRESYNFDGSEPRFITEMLVGPMSPSGAFGGNLWAARYQNIRNGNIVLNAVGEVAELSTAEKEGIRGFTKTMQALDFMLILNTRDTNGAAIDVDRPLSEPPAPLVSKPEVLSHINSLLDEGATHLGNAGESFVFPTTTGFAGFETPATFVRFNRALRARADVYAGNYAAALTALQGSFLDTSAPFTRGVYHTFGSGSGENPNRLIASTIRAHPSILTDAQNRAAGGVDLRAESKVVRTSNVTQQGVSSDVAFTIYGSNTAPLPIIRNEELILLRSEARWFTGDRAGAMADLNLVRQQSGGLAPLAQPETDADFVTALLYERRYSLLFEGGHRWIDTRRFNRLDSLPREFQTHSVQPRFPIPEAECLARGVSGECAAS